MVLEDTASIVEHHQGDKTQAMAALEKWRQTNGRFHLDVLLESLSELKRKDIVNNVKKYVARQSHPL